MQMCGHFSSLPRPAGAAVFTILWHLQRGTLGLARWHRERAHRERCVSGECQKGSVHCVLISSFANLPFRSFACLNLGGTMRLIVSFLFIAKCFSGLSCETQPCVALMLKVKMHFCLIFKLILTYLKQGHQKWAFRLTVHLKVWIEASSLCGEIGFLSWRERKSWLALKAGEKMKESSYVSKLVKRLCWGQRFPNIFFFFLV